MKQVLILFLVFLFNFILSFFIQSCSHGGSIDVQIGKEIESLSTIEKQRNFLVAIGDLDQEVRQHETKILQKFGYNSEEYQIAFKRIMKTDEENLLKIESYLKKYGHPTKEKHGEDASGIPCLVIHHATGGDEPRRRNFKHLYHAYQNGDIDAVAFTFYLNRMYDIKFGKTIDWNRPFSVEEELDTLYNALDLLSIINETKETSRGCSSNGL